MRHVSRRPSQSGRDRIRQETSRLMPMQSVSLHDSSRALVSATGRIPTTGRIPVAGRDRAGVTGVCPGSDRVRARDLCRCGRCVVARAPTRLWSVQCCFNEPPRTRARVRCWPLAAGPGDGVTIPAVAVMVVAGDGGCRIDDGGYARPSSNCQQIVDFDLAVGSVCFVVHFGAGASDWISPNSGPSMPPYSR
jgi:hypothetical protein